MGNWKIDIDPAEKDAIYSLFKAPEASDTPFIDYESDKLTTLRHYAFRNCKTINSVNTPNVSCISQACFRDSSITQYDLINVNRIMNYAFYNCSNFHGDTVHRIRSNAAVLDIGNYAFYNCNFKFPYLYAFTACIGNYAFHLSSKQDSLQRVNINQINYCNDNAFSNQGNLKAITGRSGGRMINFYNIGTNAFNGCTGLETINATNIDNICANAFNGCTSLTTINAVNVNKVINYAFNGCTGLTQIKDIKLTNVYTNAFNGCTGLTDIINVHFINANANAFRGCTSLTNLTNVYLQEIYAKTFDSLPLQTVVMNYIATTSNANIFNNCTQLSNLQINAGSIGNKPYNNINNSNLTVTLTNSTYGTMQVQAFPNVKYFYANEYTGTFPERMFENNPNLTTVNIRNVEKIDNYTFSNCTSLDQCLGNGNIGKYAYNNCSISCAGSFSGALKIDDYGIYNGMIDKSSNTITWSQVIEAGNYAFGKINYDIMNFPVLTTIYSDTFKEFAGNGLHFDILNATPTNMCNNLTQLKELYINKVKTINEYTCNNCYNLTIVNCNSDTSSLQSLLTDIYNYAFSNCQKLTTFITNSRLVNVGTNAFNGCIALTTFNGVVNFMTGTNYQFYNCKTLTSIKLLNTVTTIPNYCFYFSNALKTIGTENNIANLYYITQVGNYSFYNGGIVDLRFDNTKEVIISSDSFNGCPITSITWPKIAKLGTYVFMKTALTSVDVTNVRSSSNTMYIPSYTFRECKSLTTVTGLNHTINTYAFSQCTALTSVQGQITNVEGYAFNGCTSLTTFDCPVTCMIKENSFKNCINLEIVKNVACIGTNALQYMSSLTTLANVKTVGYQGCRDCTELTSIDGNLVNVEYAGFHNCTKLNFTNRYTSFSSIANWAFNLCTSLTHCNIRNNLTVLGQHAFNGCTALTNIQVGTDATLHTISDYCFNECTAFTGIVGLSTSSWGGTVMNINTYAFNGCINLKYPFSNIQVNIGEYAFNGCVNLGNTSSILRLPTTSTSSPYNYTIPTHSFTNCYTNFYVNSAQRTFSIYTVSSEAFCDSNTVIFKRNPETTYTTVVYIINEYGFKNITNVYLSGRFKTISANAFNGCQNVNVISDGGYNNDGSTTYLNLTTNAFNNAGNVFIAGDITGISSNTFYNCTKVTLKLTNSAVKTFTTGLNNIDISNSSNSYKKVYLQLPNNTMRDNYRNSATWKTYFNNNQTTTNNHISTNSTT